ncbi:MAG: transcriptional regulator [Alphaproteobacteria bacterium CG_4_9_14_3_um_filter_47_13]|nr:MAG: transcriptional regulator [Alphaproteobacteria bacterium CG_4_9_14_3_um_filter_47_13]
MDVHQVERNIEVAVNLLKALSNEKRLVVMCALYRGEKSVSELGNIVGLSQSALSQHLARLRRDGLVDTRRDAQTIYYSTNCQASKAILHTLYDIFCPAPKAEM